MKNANYLWVVEFYSKEHGWLPFTTAFETREAARQEVVELSFYSVSSTDKYRARKKTYERNPCWRNAGLL